MQPFGCVCHACLTPTEIRYPGRDCLSQWQVFPQQINESVTEPCLVAAGHRSLTPRVRPGWWLTVLLGLPTVAVGLALLPGDRRRPVDISSLVVSQLSLSTGSCPRADRRRPDRLLKRAGNWTASPTAGGKCWCWWPRADRTPKSRTYCVIAESTAKTRVKRVLSKIDVHDRALAVVFGYRSGLITNGR